MRESNINFDYYRQVYNYDNAFEYLLSKNVKMTNQAVDKLIHKAITRYLKRNPSRKFSFFKYVPPIDSRHWIECLDVTYEVLKDQLRPISA